MITKRTIIDQLEISRDGVIQMRFAKLIEDDGVELARGLHRAALAPGADLGQLIAAVNENLDQLGAGRIDLDDLAIMPALVALVHGRRPVRADA
jgi:hypothetical protein